MTALLSLLSITWLLSLTSAAGGEEQEIGDSDEDGDLPVQAEIVDPIDNSPPYIKVSTSKDSTGTTYCFTFKSLFESEDYNEDSGTYTQVAGSKVAFNSGIGKDCIFTTQPDKSMKGVCQGLNAATFTITMQEEQQKGDDDGAETGVSYSWILSDYNWVSTNAAAKLVMVRDMGKCADVAPSAARRVLLAGGADEEDGDVDEDEENDEMDSGKSSFDLNGDKAYDKCSSGSSTVVSSWMIKDKANTNTVHLVFGHFQCNLEMDPFFGLDNQLYGINDESKSSDLIVIIVVVVCVLFVLILIVIIALFYLKKRKLSKDLNSKPDVQGAVQNEGTPNDEGAQNDVAQNDVEIQDDVDGKTNMTYQ